MPASTLTSASRTSLVEIPMDLTVEVIKGALARQRYGTDAGSGVILMTTKQPARAGAIR